MTHIDPITTDYQILLIDPPWPYDDKQANRPDNYARMTLREIMELPINRLMAEDAVIYCWATFPMIEGALFCLREWDAEYKTAGFVWIKTTKDEQGLAWGMGHHTRANGEPCLLGVRGNGLPRTDGGIHQVVGESELITAPRGDHSAKASDVHRRLELMYGLGPKRLEMFARGNTPPGWDGHGHECTNAVVVL